MFTTKAIILRTTKYGETSLVVSAFTELFGIQNYLVNGVRSAKVNNTKATLYLPCSILEMEVYHNEKNNLHRIKNCNRAYVYENLFSDVVKNCIALFCVELLSKLLKQPEQQLDLFEFCEDAFVQLDNAPQHIAANFPLFYALHLSYFFGFKINDNYSDNNCYLDLLEGAFTEVPPLHQNFLQGIDANIISELLKVTVLQELDLFKLNQQKRRELMQHIIMYYNLHISDFGQMKTLKVMQAIMS
jgi:DNA repair protein RecO (recombination protein O)